MAYVQRAVDGERDQDAAADDSCTKKRTAHEAPSSPARG